MKKIHFLHFLFDATLADFLSTKTIALFLQRLHDQVYEEFLNLYFGIKDVEL